MNYAEYIQSKSRTDHPTGIDVAVKDLNPMLFDFQRDIVRWALKRGRAAIFADCGLGKTPMQLEWARHVSTMGKVLIVAPLAVSAQTQREGVKFGVDVAHSQDGTVTAPITITNYERLHHFDTADFVGIVLDESSILKSYTGKYRNELVLRWKKLPYRLACTATPAPNDYMELGNHSEFLGVMDGSEMLASFFINDPANVGRYKVKGHANAGPFWEWMASWSVMIRKPADLGYDDGDFSLPECHFNDIVIDSNKAPEGMLFPVDAQTMGERQGARRATIEDRAARAIDIVNGSDERWLVWCDLNRESDILAKGIEGAVEVRGSDKDSHKEKSLLGFANGDIRVLVSKPKIAGWGMNFQICRNMVFTGLSDSYEQFYQAVRRCWRFGQTREVNCYIVTDRTEGAVVANVRRKEKDAAEMADNMAAQMSYISSGIIREDVAFAKAYNTSTTMEIPSWLNA